MLVYFESKTPNELLIKNTYTVHFILIDTSSLYIFYHIGFKILILRYYNSNKWIKINIW